MTESAAALMVSGLLFLRIDKMDFSTIAAISTPEAAGGLGVIRISGPEALTITDKIFSPVSGTSILQSAGYHAHYGRVHDGETAVDDAVCLVFRAPHSYTGEDTCEITCHGGLFVTKAVLRAAFNSGAVPAQAGEFTKRAFLNGKIDLAESEAVMSLISAQGEQAAKAALNTLDGHLSKKIKDAAGKIISVCASLAAWVDYPYDEIEDTSPDEMLDIFKDVKGEIETIISHYDSGKIYTQGVDTAIVGRPNVGKSTLMNLLSGCERSIVTDIAGTTRDVVEESVRLGSMILRIADTAGIRSTDNAVESIGVDLAKKRLSRAYLVLAVFDSSCALDSDDMDILEQCKGRTAIAVINKSDLEKQIDTDIIREYIPMCVEISAQSGNGADDLEKTISELLGSAAFNPENPCLANERQRECCIKALGFIDEAVSALNAGVTLDAVTVCAQCAVDALLELTGEKATDSTVDEIFSRFCVGK